MEAARTSETSVDIQLRTRQYIPEDSELHTRRRENLKSHITYSRCQNTTPTCNIFYCLLFVRLPKVTDDSCVVVLGAY
jgi:hypothetical protein